MGFLAISFLRNRPAKRVLEPNESLMVVAIQELAGSLKEMCVEYPQCARYFLALCLSNNGVTTFLLVYPTYFSQQIKVDQTTLTIISAMVVMVAGVATFIFSKVAHLVRLHKVLFGTILGFGVTTGTTTLFFNHPDHLSRAYAVGVIYGVLIGFYSTCQYSALVQLLPKHKIGKYTGLFPALKNIANSFGPTIYAGIAQRTNNQMMALSLSIVPFTFLSLIPLFLTDFAAGARQVQQEENRVRKMVRNSYAVQEIPTPKQRQSLETLSQEANGGPVIWLDTENLDLESIDS